MITDEQMIAGWYGDLRPKNEEKRMFMLDTGHVFEMHSVEKVITEENVLNKIRVKYTPENVFIKTFFSNYDLLKQFRTHVPGMGLE